MQKKYLVLIGALLAQVTIGSLYAWSIFDTAIQSELGWDKNTVYIVYALAQFVFAFSTILSGKLVDKRGPKFTTLVGGSLFGGGLILTSFATSPFMMYITYSLMVGTGIGFIYVSPLTTLIKWFPTKKGLMTGLSVSVFAGGSILFKEIIQILIDLSNVKSAFMYLGLISGAVIFSACIFISNPEGFKKAESTKGENDYTTVEMIRTTKYKLIAIMYLFAVIPGLLVLGAAKNIGLELAGLTGVIAATGVTITAISNAGSRLLSGALSDKFSILTLLKLSMVITIVGLLMLALLDLNAVTFYIGVALVAIGYGGALCLFPSLTNQEFGSYAYGANYGIVYQSYGIAALAGIFIKAATSGFAQTFIISAIAAGVGLVASMFIKERKLG